MCKDLTQSMFKNARASIGSRISFLMEMRRYFWWGIRFLLWQANWVVVSAATRWLCHTLRDWNTPFISMLRKASCLMWMFEQSFLQQCTWKSPLLHPICSSELCVSLWRTTIGALHRQHWLLNTLDHSLDHAGLYSNFCGSFACIFLSRDNTRKSRCDVELE